MYSDKARALRRCMDKNRRGEPCKAWAVWDDPRQLCVVHAGRHHRGRLRFAAHKSERTNNPACTCLAYSWPHRPGGGLCRWPDEPLMMSRIPVGTHSWPRVNSDMKALMRVIQRRVRRDRQRAKKARQGFAW
jgi:hypothetical protein